MERDDFLVVTNVVIGILFLISEVLGWSNCNANSVSEVFIGRCFGHDWFIRKNKVQNERTSTLTQEGVIVINGNTGDEKFNEFGTNSGTLGPPTRHRFDEHINNSQTSGSEIVDKKIEETSAETGNVA